MPKGGIEERAGVLEKDYGPLTPSCSLGGYFFCDHLFLVGLRLCQAVARFSVLGFLCAIGHAPLHITGGAFTVP